MDPLSLTASVMTVATLAWKSTKAAYNIVDGLVEAPTVIVDSKRLLSETQNTLDTLRDALDADTKKSSVLESVLKKIKLNHTLEAVQCLCVEFGETLKGYTKHSTDSRLGKRDRLTVSFHESKTARFNRQLRECQGTISLVVGSINLIVAIHTSEDVKRLGSQFAAQETALIDLEKRLLDAMTLAVSDGTANGSSTSEQDLTATLQTLCQDALSATRAKRTGQTFGDQETDIQSFAMQGIVGTAQSGVEQTFGNQTTTNGSRAYQGQIDAVSFAAMFGK